MSAHEASPLLSRWETFAITRTASVAQRHVELPLKSAAIERELGGPKTVSASLPLRVDPVGIVFTAFLAFAPKNDRKSVVPPTPLELSIPIRPTTLLLRRALRRPLGSTSTARANPSFEASTARRSEERCTFVISPAELFQNL